MTCVLDAVNREELYDVVTSVDVFEELFKRLRPFFEKMFYAEKPKNPLFFMSLFGSFLGEDIANYLFKRFEHLNYTDEIILVEERPFSDYSTFSSYIASDLRLLLTVEPDIYPIILLKGEDGLFYLNLFIL